MLSQTMRRFSPDFLGGALSFICLIHCLLLPWMAALLPVTRIVDDSAHTWLFLTLAPVAVFAGWSGFREHRHRLPAMLMSAGMLLVGSAAFTPVNPTWEVPLTAAGSLLLIAGHLHNGQLREIHRISNSGLLKSSTPETGEAIGLKRLPARPTATLTLEAQERHEQRERQFSH